ncbi:SGNH/GDSL hydrolase family protein [Phycicoccus avicenniae]|uniref:SGNH/GDSL hydrolase family protein n=1 Tax=Phycicoccus avicenniae TaxID=2828860 RepID=UPI003D2926DD
MPRTTVVASALAAVLALSACGGGSEDPAPSAAPSSSSAAPTASPSPSTTSPSARPGTGPDSTAPDGPLYVALGDSLAAGYQPGGAELRDSAYPALAAARLGRGGDALGVANLACSGETTGSFLAGGKCEYPESSQMAQAESLLKARRGDVRLVTIDLGGNDLLRCAARLSVDAKCAATGLGTIEKNLPTILSRLRAAAGPDVPVLVLGYYNPWLASSYLGAGQAQLKVATKAFSDLSTTIAAAAKGSGGRFVSLDAAFALDDDTPTTFSGRSVPKNVAQVCSLTYICTAFDIHLTDEGAAVVGRVLADAATKAGVR